MLRLILRRILRFFSINIFNKYLLDLLRKLPYSRFGKFSYSLFRGSEMAKYFNVNVRVNPGDNLGFYLYFFNGYENELTEMIIDISSNYPVFFDVGANYGWISLAVAKNTDSVEVYSFEPDKEIAKEFNFNLNNNTELKNKVNLINKAVHDSDNNVNFAPSKMESNPGIGRITDSENNGYSMEGTSLDSFCEKNNVYPDIIKIDVEGAELKVLKGMQKLLADKRTAVLFIEIHGFYYGDNASEFNKEIISELLSYNYHIYVLDGKKQLTFNNDFFDLTRMHIVAYSENI